MKRIFTLALIFSAFTASAQQKLIGINSSQYDETGTLTGIDSSEYIYNSWGGSIYSNEPQFRFDGSVIDWSYELPSIKWDVENIYSGLSLIETRNNTFVGFDATVSESASDKDEYTYDTAGNLTSKKSYYYNGTTFVLYIERTYEYDANNNKTVEEYIGYGTGSPIVENFDSLFYDASNNLTRYISHEWDGTSAYYPSTESLLTYAGSEVSHIDLYQGSQSAPLELEFEIDYTFVANQPTNITGYQVVGGVADTVPTVEIEFTYGANQKLSLYQAFLSGDLFNEVAYTYDGQNFLAEMVESELDFNTSALYVAEELNFYYQNTAGIDDFELAEATVSPNPSSDFVTISTDAEIEAVSVFNSNGSIMISQNGGDLDISNLPVGVYLAKVKTSTGVAQARFVKQ